LAPFANNDCAGSMNMRDQHQLSQEPVHEVSESVQIMNVEMKGYSFHAKNDKYQRG
jgi:hypothetical protein